MNKFILLLLSIFSASIFAAEPAPVYNKTATAAAVKVVVSRTKKRQLKLLYYASGNSEIDDSDPGPDADDLDMCVGYRRPKLSHDDSTLEVDTIPNRVLKRLTQARQLAVKRHYEVWG